MAHANACVTMTAVQIDASPSESLLEALYSFGDIMIKYSFIAGARLEKMD